MKKEEKAYLCYPGHHGPIGHLRVGGTTKAYQFEKYQVREVPESVAARAALSGWLRCATFLDLAKKHGVSEEVLRALIKNGVKAVDYVEMEDGQKIADLRLCCLDPSTLRTLSVLTRAVSTVDLKPKDLNPKKAKESSK